MALQKLSTQRSSIKSWLLGLSPLALALVLSACSSAPKDPTAGWSPNKIYSEAKEEAAAGAWDKAIGLYEKLEGRAAGTPLALQAQIEKAYAQFKSGEPAQAIATLDRFLKLHPASPGVDYALYLKGLINFNDDLGFMGRVVDSDLSERDQKASKEAYEAFRQLVDRFPDSKYTPDAQARMTYIVGSLARYEVHVARYYFSKGAYPAAINRAQAALSDYKEVPATEEALWILSQSYAQLGMKDLAADSLRVLQRTFPKSAYLAGGATGVSKPWWRVLW
ncbi:MAG: putative outer rane assembly lipoprotein YfiO [Pseudomonadota bacterium]|jgi:outer membrane protein assembly factor BamD